MDIFESIKATIDASQSIVLIPHINADGDATGSCFALAMFLKRLGKSVDVVFEEFPRLSSIVYHDFIVYDGEKRDYDLSVAVDCGDMGRMGSRAELFCGKTICIDHHKTNGNIGDINYVEPQSSSTGELIFELISHISPELLDRATAEAIYMAISADTGCFKYSNVSERTHKIAARLYEIGGDFSEINRKLFDTVPIRKMRFQADAVNAIEFYCENRVAMYYLSYEEYKERELTLGDVEFISSMLKTVEGVSVGVFIHEREPGEYKVSLRSDDALDSSVVASSFGGGGHSRAAGFSAEGNALELVESIIASIKSNLVID